MQFQHLVKRLNWVKRICNSNSFSSFKPSEMMFSFPSALLSIIRIIIFWPHLHSAANLLGFQGLPYPPHGSGDTCWHLFPLCHPTSPPHQPPWPTNDYSHQLQHGHTLDHLWYHDHVWSFAWSIFLSSLYMNCCVLLFTSASLFWLSIVKDYTTSSKCTLGLNKVVVDYG